MTANKKMNGPPFLTALRHQSLGSVRSIGVSVGKGICFGLLAAGLANQQGFSADDTAQLSNSISLLPEDKGAASSAKSESVRENRQKRANFEHESASHDARHVADWVVDSGDNRSMPFVIIDKTNAKVFVFNADGRLRGAAPALLGLARGDDAVPGIGDRKLSSIRPEERTTPAGRFVASLDRNLRGGEILWVDYEGGVSLHPVITANPKEHRAQRLATPTPLDNRISFGCINVPAQFFAGVVSPVFTGTNGIVYVLPETRSPQKVFNSYNVGEGTRLQTASQHLPAQLPAKSDTKFEGR